MFNQSFIGLRDSSIPPLLDNYPFQSSKTFRTVIKPALVFFWSLQFMGWFVRLPAVFQRMPSAPAIHKLSVVKGSIMEQSTEQVKKRQCILCCCPSSISRSYTPNKFAALIGLSIGMVGGWPILANLTMKPSLTHHWPLLQGRTWRTDGGGGKAKSRKSRVSKRQA